MAETPTGAVKKELAPILVPLKAEEAEGPLFLRLLVMGFSSIGKSCTVTATSPGPVYVINSDDPEALSGVKRFTLDFKHNFINSSKGMGDAIELARHLVRHEGVKTVVWDTITGFSPFLEAEAFKATLTQAQNEDGRKAWPLYHKTLRGLLGRLLKLKCHVVVCSHYLDVGGGTDDEEQKGVAKTGKGIVPLLGGQSRAVIPRMFTDKVFMEKITPAPGVEQRVFVTGIEGVFGPGMKSIAGNRVLPADIEALIALIEKERWAPGNALLNARGPQALAKPKLQPIIRPAKAVAT